MEVRELAAFPAGGVTEAIERPPEKLAGAPLATSSDWPLTASLLHGVLWGVLVCAFVSYGATALLPEILRDRIGPVDPLHTINRSLQAGTGAARSPQLLEAISRLPRDGQVVIFMGEDAMDSLLGMAISYLVWPRDVQTIIGNDEVVAERLARIGPDSVGAVVFCKVNPPAWFAAGEVCAPGVRVVCLRPPETN